MNWNHLYCFYEVARLGSVKNAALALSCAPSTLSEQIKKLELSLEIQLFTKAGRDLVLSDAGRGIYEEARFMFEKGKRLVESVKPNDLAGYNVKIAIENHLETPSVYKFLSKYWENYSDFGLIETKRSKNLSQSIYFLENEIVDMVLTSSPISDHNFFSFKILTLKYGLYIQQGLTSLGINAKELVGRFPFAFFGTNEKDEFAIRSMLLECGLQIKEEVRSEHPEFLIDLCRQGKIVLLLPLSQESKVSGLELIALDREIEISVFALGRKSNEQLLFTRRLLQLSSAVHSNHGITPSFVSQFLSSSLRGSESFSN